MGKVISLLNHKGGTGKTTCATNIAAELTRRNKRVLLIDFDPQANLSQGLGLFDIPNTIYSALSHNKDLPIINLGDLHIVPSSLDLSALETELSSKLAREQVLNTAIKQVKSNYDYIIIDCPPSLGVMTINCLVASDSVIVPLEAEFFALKGIDTIIDVLNKVNNAFSKNINIAGVILNEYNPRKKLTQSIETELKENLGETVLNTPLRTNIAISESQINGKHIFNYDPKSNAAKDFENIVTELITKGRI